MSEDIDLYRNGAPAGPSRSLLAASVLLGQEFYARHHFRVSDADGAVVGHYASAKCGAFTVFFRPVKDGVMHDMAGGHAYSAQDCKTIALQNWTPDRDGPGGIEVGEAA